MVMGYGNEFLPLVLRRLGIWENVRPIKKLSDEMLAWLSVWIKVQMIWST